MLGKTIKIKWFNSNLSAIDSIRFIKKFTKSVRKIALKRFELTDIILEKFNKFGTINKSNVDIVSGLISLERISIS